MFGACVKNNYLAGSINQLKFNVMYELSIVYHDGEEKTIYYSNFSSACKEANLYSDNEDVHSCIVFNENGVSEYMVC